jgi:hypothetical protein
MDVQPELVDDFIYLAGRPSIRDFVSFARRQKINGEDPDKEPLIREWQQANERVRALAETEKGLADDAELLPLPDDMRPMADAELNSAAVRRMWEGLRYDWRLVDVDRLIVFQKSINLRFVDDIKATLPAGPSNEDMIRFAVGKAWQSAPVRITRSDEHTFLCVSSSNDVRILEIKTFDPANIQGYTAAGYASSIIGICVGFSVNLLAAVQVRNRLVLFNGSHRAFALRALGVRHVPCLVLNLSREDEFDLKAPEALKENRDLYLRSPRPPLFKDYFDPGLTKQVRVPRTNQLVQLQIGYQKIALSAM